MLGGATLPMFLRKHYPSAEIDIAEIDPDVVNVAKTFFGFREDERMRIHVGDGRRFIENIRQPRYDVIFVDAYGAHNVPEHLTTQEFLQAVRLALVPSGVVVGNVWGPSSNRLYDSMVRTYQEAFDELFIVNVSGDVNSILLALPRSNGSVGASSRSPPEKYRPPGSSASTWAIWSSTAFCTRTRRIKMYACCGTLTSDSLGRFASAKCERM